MLVRFILASLALVAGTSMTIAADAMVGGVQNNLPPPAGFCDLGDSDPSDKRMLSTVADLVTKLGNKLLGMSADCRQLGDWRSHKRSLLDDFSQYQAPLSLIDKPMPEPVKQTCATLRTQGDQLVAEQFPDMKARVESAMEKVKLNNMSFMGVLAEDATACYAALLQKLHTEVGTDKTQVVMIAATVVKNKNVFVYRIAVYANSATLDRGLANLKADVRRLLAANRK